MTREAGRVANHLHVHTRHEWRVWLERYGAQATEVWVVLTKKKPAASAAPVKSHASSARRGDVGGGPRVQSVTYDDLVEEALCFGWIDSIVRTLDAGSYAQRFTPRKATSKWSASNIARVRRLEAAGLMAPAGLAAFATHADRAQAPHPTTLPAELERSFRTHRRAWDYFSACPPGYRRTTIGWVASAKKEETRRKRLETLMQACERGERLKFV